MLALFLLIGALSRGPISFSFASPYIGQVLASQYPELDLDFSDLQLLWDGQDRNLVFGVSDVSVKRGEEPIARIPAVTVTFSGEALMKGRLAPAGLEFSGLKVLLTRKEDGTVRLGYSYDTDLAVETPEAKRDGLSIAAIHELLNGLGEKKSESDLTAYLERLEIYRSGLFIEDERLQKLWRVTSANMVLWRSEDGLTGRLIGDAQIGDESISMVANAAYARRDGTTVINTQITDFPPSLLAKEMPDLDILQGVDLPVSGDINVSLDKSFIPVQVGFKLKTGAGKVDIPSLYKKPLDINSVFAEGHTAAPFKAVNLNSILIDSKGPKISMSGSFMETDKGFGMSIEGSFPHLKSNDLPLYWPYSTGVDAYNWVTKKIREGDVHNTTFRVDLPPGAIASGKIPDGAIELKFSFEGLSVDYFAPLPKVTNVAGQAILTEKQIHLFDLTGDLQTMKLPTADVLVYDFDKDDQIADITIDVSGQNKDIFAFLDLKPLELVTPYGITPAKMKGTGKVQAQFVFPLLDDLKLEQVVYEANGDFFDTYIPAVYEKVNLSDGTLKVAVTPKQLTVTGPAKLKGNPAQISFQSWFEGTRKGVRRYEVQARLDKKARQSLDLDTEYLKGPVGASLGLDVAPGGKSSGVITLNLLEAEIDIPDLYVNKPIGVTGLLGAQFETDGKGNALISNIRLNSESLDVVGEAELDPAGMKSFRASSISFGETTLALDLRRNKDKDYTANITADILDLKPFIVGSNSLNPGRADENPTEIAVQVNLKAGTALLDGGVSLKDLSGTVKSINGVVEQGNATARFTDKVGLQFNLKQSLTGRQVSFSSDHAGLLLRGLDIYDNAREGALSITASIDDTKEESVAIGEVKIKDLRVVKAPVLGKILTLGSLGGIVELLQNDGMTFSTVEGPFTYENGLITTKDFRAVGSIGITFSGQVDQTNGKIDAFGTVIPSYTLNSILGNIPILGTLLVGREGEGIFGFSYKAKGSTANPDISVNPVSALAPGILRRMFFEPWGDQTEKTDKKDPDASNQYPGENNSQ